MLQQLQAILGETSTLAVDLARALPAETLDRVLASGNGLTIAGRGHGFAFGFDSGFLAPVRGRLATAPA